MFDWCEYDYSWLVYLLLNSLMKSSQIHMAECKSVHFKERCGKSESWNILWVIDGLVCVWVCEHVFLCACVRLCAPVCVRVCDGLVCEVFVGRVCTFGSHLSIFLPNFICLHEISPLQVEHGENPHLWNTAQKLYSSCIHLNTGVRSIPPLPNPLMQQESST